MIRIHNPEKQGAHLAGLEGTRHIIAVEGADDAAVTEFLARGTVDDALIYVAGGETKLSRVISLLMDLRGSEDLESITIMRDANGDPEAKNASSIAIFRSLGLHAPQSAFVLGPGRPKAGILLMPPSGTGCLESVLLDAYPRMEDRDHARAFAKAIDQGDPTASQWTISQTAKREMRALLGVGSKRLDLKWNTIIPRASRQGLWRPEHPAFRPYLEYFSSLAGL